MPSARRLLSSIKSDSCEAAGCASLPDTPLWLCINCSSLYCDLCWDTQGPHKRGKVGEDGRPHERTEKEVYARLRPIFHPPENESALQKLHQDDEEALWFGVETEENKCVLTDSGRYAALMAATKQPTGSDRYPLLISFIGQTGAGKSTLIKMLVALKESNLVLDEGMNFSSPVAGSVKNDRSPTSGDVHLYVDPQTAYSDLPMLYADCEGLEGGNVPPKAALFRQGTRKKDRSLEYGFEGRAREVNMPKLSELGKGYIGKREWAVRNIYPRMLYTFSDVVVFVLKNTRTFESTALRLLLEWASTSIESSVNQPALPQAIIVLNASDPEMDDDEWDTRTATERLFEHVSGAYFEEPLKKYFDPWAKKGRMIRNTKELLKCYYADVKVIRIPTKGKYMLAKKQINELHMELLWACTASFKAKWEARQSCTTDELNKYLQAGFDHFAQRPTDPFNFVHASIKSDPIPQSFADHILNLARSAAPYNFWPRSWFEIFRRLSKVVASCILIDCVHYRRLGKPLDLFDQQYASSCAVALENYHSLYLPCSFRSKKGKACVNTRLGHEKGHQSEKGKILAVGAFQSEELLDFYESEFCDIVAGHLEELDDELSRWRQRGASGRLTDQQFAYDFHRDNLSAYFGSFEEDIVGANNMTCYGCLMEVPQHALPCGHVLCTNCVKMFGQETDSHTVTMNFCPIARRNSPTFVPISIRFKPAFAGVRVLSLDGGGMRGIVELEILRAIEQRFGEGLPIQVFFDLIVGTSTGGLIALGLGVKQWTVEQCISRFVQLCGQAFQAQAFAGTTILKTFSFMRHRSKYKSQPFREALLKNFGSEYLYGGAEISPMLHDAKVAVTTTSMSGDVSYLYGNYIRQDEDDHFYDYQPGLCMQVWQAAAATSAAPKYFKRFECQHSCGCCVPEEFLDGAIYYNNPVSVANNERRFLFPDVAEKHPDVLLSIGTGMHAQHVSTAMRKEKPYLHPSKRATACVPSLLGRLKKSLPNGEYIGRVAKIIDLIANRIDSILDAEQEFRTFHTSATQHAMLKETHERYIRLNVDLGKEPPALDETAEMVPLQEKVRRLLHTPTYEPYVEGVAHRLIASTFYFAKSRDVEHDKATSSYLCTGRIACRFEGSAPVLKDRLRRLGEYFRRQTTQNFSPYFTIKDKADDIDYHKIEITRQAIDDMVDVASYRVAENISIRLPSKQVSTTIWLCLPTASGGSKLYTISGFPRYLVTEDISTANRLQKRAELIRSRIHKNALIVGDPLMDYLQEEQPSTEAEYDSTTARVESGGEDDEVTLLSESPKSAPVLPGPSVSEPDLKASLESSRSSENSQARSSTNARTNSLEEFRKKLKAPSRTIVAIENFVQKNASAINLSSIPLRSKKSSLDNTAHRTTSLPDRVPEHIPEEPASTASSNRIGVIDATQLLNDDEIMPELEAEASNGTTNGHEDKPDKSRENGSGAMQPGSGEDSDSDGPPDGYDAEE